MSRSHYTIDMKIVWIPLTIILLNVSLAHSQNRSTKVTNEKHQDIRDSLKTVDYPYLFPIFGKKVLEKGYELPNPAGVNATFVIQNQELTFENLEVGFNDIEPVPLDFVVFGKNEVSNIVASVRADLWLFPFLNVYLIAAKSHSETTTRIVDPVAMETITTADGNTYGFGLVGAFGVGPGWLSVDWNNTWTETNLTNEPVHATVMGLRFGLLKRLKKNGKTIQPWIGTQFQQFESKTDGTIRFDEVFPEPPDPGFTDEVRGTDWYMDLPPPQRTVVDEILDAIDDKTSGIGTEGHSISYRMDKSTTKPWNMVVGMNYQHDYHWNFRGEFGFLGTRNSFMASASYRFGFKIK